MRTPGQDLRAKLGPGRLLVLPGAYNPFTAMQLEQVGFEGVYLSGAGLANSLGLPDDGTLGLEDFLYLGRWMRRAVSLPIVADADTGFANVEDTVRRYIETGFAAIQLEDQVAPKRCGHLGGKEVVPRGEMADRLEAAGRVRAALDPDFVIVARTDARGADNVEEARQLEECVARARLYSEAGADVIFPESLRSREEFARLRREVPGYLLANMTEFGKTPYLQTREFQDLGYNVLIFPVSLFRYHAGKTREFLARLRQDGNQEGLAGDMLDRDTINALLKYRTSV